jgi:threonine/homoserine/homoserine lactone efflux protein
MTIASMFSLFVALVVLAAIPGPGVFTVIARSIASGFFHGLVTVFGILVGDYVFILFSIYGLSALANTMGGFFAFIKYAGAVYLVWLGVKLLFTKKDSAEIKPVKHGMSFVSNFITGLVTTLSNPKAILFYVSFFPAFVNLDSLDITQIICILLIATIAVGSVMIAYAFAASKTSSFFDNRKANRALNMTAGSIMISGGVIVATKA